MTTSDEKENLSVQNLLPEQNVLFEETPERLKVTIPLKVNWLLFILHAFGLGIWLAMIGVVVVYLFRGLSNSFVLTALIVIWMLFWLWFGRFLWNRWQYYAANREILFIDQEQVIVRRPLSILGITNAYDRRYVSPLYYSENHNCPAFDYAYAHVYFGHSLPESEARALITDLNARYFPDEDEDE
jgi:hypothetical protein